MSTEKYIVRKGFNVSLPDSDPKRPNKTSYEGETILLTSSEYNLVAHQVEKSKPDVPQKPKEVDPLLPKELINKQDK